jgi:PEGA domain
MSKCVLPILCILLTAFLISPVTCQSVIGEDNGFFSISSFPEEGQVIMDGIYRGNTPIIVPVSSKGTSSHTITVSKPGYLPWTRTYDSNPAAGETIFVSAVIEPSTDQGTLIVKSSPSGALVTIDGSMGQQTTWTYDDIPAGSHVVRAFLSGYQPYLTLVNVPAGGTITVDAPLTPLSLVGALQVKSSPGGADIYVDGFYSGSTAATVGNLAAGPHFITLRLAGYKDWLGTIEIPENSVAFVDAQLEVASATTTGAIQVYSNPPGASVYHDGVYQGTTKPGDALDLTGILPGTHTILLQLQNYQDYTSQVEVHAGQVSQVKADLAAKTPSQSGILFISSNPQGANVFLDNAFTGITPLTIPSVTSGNHTLLLRLAGYTDYSTLLTISPGQAVQVQAALNPVATPTRAGILTVVIGTMAAVLLLRKK